MLRSRARIVLLFWLTVLTLLSGPWPENVCAAGVNDQFNQAWREFQDIVKDDKRSKYRSFWQDLEKRFLAVWKADPEGESGPKALYYAARSMDEMGRQSYLKADLRKAVEYYDRMAATYPGHAWSDDGLYRKAFLEWSYLKEPEQALADCNRILKQYPKGDIWPKAQDLVNEIRGAGKAAAQPGQEQAAESNAPEAVAPAPARTETTTVVSASQAEAPATSAEPSVSATISRMEDIRHQGSDEYTRIVIDVDKPVRFRYELLGPNPEHNKPNRLYVDLENTVLGAKARRDLDISDGILSRVRAAQNRPDVVRVVLDFQALQKFQVFALENPFRLIVDVSAASRPSTRTAKAEPARETSPTPAPETPRVIAHAPAPAPTPSTEPAGVTRAPPAKPADAVNDAPVKRPVTRLPRKSMLTGQEDPSPQAETAQTERETAAESERAANAALSRAQGSYRPPADCKKQAGTLVQQLGLTVHTIMIDAGHGGKDPGASGVGGIKEKDVNLDFALILGRELKKEGFDVIYTRTTDKFIALEDRTAMANVQKADLFISIHCNAIGIPGFSGMETYYLDLATSKDAVRVAARENAVSTKSISDLQVILTDLMLNSKLKESKDLAKATHARMSRGIKAKYPVKDNGVRSAPFYVLMGAKMPAVLVELGYITNAAEAKRLQSDAYLSHIAKGISQGVLAYKRQIERFASL